MTYSCDMRNGRKDWSFFTYIVSFIIASFLFLLREYGIGHGLKGVCSSILILD